MKLNKLFAVPILLLAWAVCAFAQNPPSVTGGGKYGVDAWAVMGQRNAAQFNYDLDASIQNGLGLWNYPANQVQTLICKGSGQCLNPFNTNASVNVIDVISANSEVVTLNSDTISGNIATLSLATSNSHSSFHLRSGTCGLREALNDLGSNGGEVIVDQKFYDDGCTASTITGLTVGSSNPATGSPGLQANQYIHDISNGKDTWYNLQPSTLTALAVPTTSATLVCAATAGLVCQSATTGGTWPNSAEYVGDIYVDALGGWSVASTTATLTPSASGTNVLQFNSPAASTGAVGWLPFGGLTYNSATYVLPVTASNCVLSTAFTGYPVCAIGSNATMLGPVVTTSLIPQSGGIAAAYNPNVQSHTVFAYAPSQRPGYQFQLNYGPFPICPALTAGQLCVVGTTELPTGFLQSLGIGGTIKFSFDVSATPSTGATAHGIDVEIGDITDFSTGTPKIVCTLLDVTASGTAAIKYHEECTWTVNALGATGTIMPGGFGIEQVAAQGTIGNAYAEAGTAAITTDVLHQDSVYFVYLQTSGADSTTPPHMLNLQIQVLNN